MFERRSSEDSSCKAQAQGWGQCWRAGWLELEGEDSICKAEGWHRVKSVDGIASASEG